jgi:hypothetical protein
MNPAPQRIAGHYRIERELVAEEDLRRWAAVDERDDSPVEVIAPRAHALLREGARAAFDQVWFEHEAVLPVLARVEVEGVPMRVRPISQGSLAGARLTPDEALLVARWLVPAVRAGAGAFGGELRPEDILVDASGVPRLGAIRLPRPDSVSRVPFHRAPEVLAEADDDAAPTVSSDLFGLGVLLYRAVTGVEPYPADSASQLRLRSHGAPPLSEYVEVPPELERIVNGLVSLDPGDRDAVEIVPPEEPPTLVLVREHDAPVAARVLPSRNSPPQSDPPWAVVVPLLRASEDVVRRIAARAGVGPDVVRRAAETGQYWVLDVADSQHEAMRLARRHAVRGLDARPHGTAAPGMAQHLLVALVSLVLWMLAPKPWGWAFLGVTVLFVGLAVRALRRGVEVARVRWAVSERQRVAVAAGPEGRAWTLERRLREAEQIPAPLRADLRDAVDAVQGRLEDLAVADGALAPAGAAVADERRKIGAEREQLGQELAKLELDLTRATAEMATEGASPRAEALGQLARSMSSRRTIPSG